VPSLDYIIVGQGMAGSMLTWFLEKEKKSFIIIDKSNSSSASNVGAGIIHPITGRRIVKTWMADELVPFAHQTYSALEEYFGAEFYHNVPVLELLSSAKEVNEWQSRSETAETANYIAAENRNELYNDVLKPFSGKVQINYSGWVDMQKIIKTLRHHFAQDNELLDEVFVHEELKLNDGKVFYKNFEADKVIFCEGYTAQYNPLWKHLPFLPAKGEILTIESSKLNLQHILVRGIFILPLSNNRYRVGSNYEWNDLSETPTETVKEKLLKQLDEIIDIPYKVIEQSAGIRPSVKDRRPFLGLHPDYPQVSIFNGLGAKGALLAPYFAKHMADFLVNGKKLNHEVDVQFKHK
jgi:glycine/D-amino acid oxidase-like deaminating enzyme